MLAFHGARHANREEWHGVRREMRA